VRTHYNNKKPTKYNCLTSPGSDDDTTNHYILNGEQYNKKENLTREGERTPVQSMPLLGSRLYQVRPYYGDLIWKGERVSETVYAFTGVTTVTGTTILWGLSMEGRRQKK